MGVASCQTPPKVKSVNNGTIEATEPKVVTKTVTLPGTVVNNPYPVPDSSLTKPADDLTLEHITGDDIEPEAAMATAVAWSGQYHKLALEKATLVGWIMGVRAGQNSNVTPTGQVISDPP